MPEIAPTIEEMRAANVIDELNTAHITNTSPDLASIDATLLLRLIRDDSFRARILALNARMFAPIGGNPS